MMRTGWVPSLIVVLFAGPAVAQGVSGNPENGQALYAPCVACHGANGEGNQALHAPRLAGQQGWYLKRQLANFKAGVRGAHPDDVYGQQMAPMAATLPDEQAVQDVVAFIAQLDSPPPAPTVQGGHAEQGQAYYTTCAACHGTGGEGNEALNAPRLTGQHDWYLIRQLANFKAGVRGAHPDDVYGQQMAPMAATLPDEQAVQDVVAFIQSLK